MIWSSEYYKRRLLGEQENVDEVGLYGLEFTEHENQIRVTSHTGL